MERLKFTKNPALLPLFRGLDSTFKEAYDNVVEQYGIETISQLSEKKLAFLIDREIKKMALESFEASSEQSSETTENAHHLIRTLKKMDYLTDTLVEMKEFQRDLRNNRVGTRIELHTALDTLTFPNKRLDTSFLSAFVEPTSNLIERHGIENLDLLPDDLFLQLVILEMKKIVADKAEATEDQDAKNKTAENRIFDKEYIQGFLYLEDRDLSQEMRRALKSIRNQGANFSKYNPQKARLFLDNKY